MYQLAPIGVTRLADGARLTPADGAPWADYLAWIASGGTPEPEPATPETPLSTEEKTARLTDAIQKHLNGIARSRGYDDIRSAAVRAGYAGQWQTEGSEFGQWMDRCWTYAYQQLNAYLAGDRTEPTAEELIAELPKMQLQTQ